MTPPSDEANRDVAAQASGSMAAVLAALKELAVRSAPPEPLPWLDTMALVLAAGVRIGERGMHRGGVANSNDAGPATVDPMRDREVMDADEVARFLGVDRKTVYDYAARGEIPCRRIGKRVLFSRSALVAWLAPCKVASRVNGA